MIKPITNAELENNFKRLTSKAKSTSGISPWQIKNFSNILLDILRKCFNKCLGDGIFPEKWLEAAVFFLHKKKNKKDPNNYRSISIQNPFLKLFSTLLSARLRSYVEKNNLLPDFQFGFREKRSTVGAAAILVETIRSQFSKRKRTYACFIDFKKMLRFN